MLEPQNKKEEDLNKPVTEQDTPYPQEEKVENNEENKEENQMEQKNTEEPSDNGEAFDKKKMLKIGIGVGIIVGGALLIWFLVGGGKDRIKGLKDTGDGTAAENGISKKQSPLNTENASYLSGLSCDNHNRRAISVMLASDTSVRPLSGLSEADMVFEMPCITASITRLMGVFVCNSPKEIGSIRSARHDYITLAKGLDSIYAHWGGSHFALEMLKNVHTVNDLDALKNPHGAFYRKDGVPAPDNGFTSYEKLWNASEKIGYRLENHFEGYPHQQESDPGSRPKGGNLRVGFAGAFGVNYAYDPETNSYLRTWGKQEDVDDNNGERIAPKNVVVMFATSRQIEGQYNDVDVEGEGEMFAYMDGQEIKGKWAKDKKDCVVGNELVCMTHSKLKFIKEDGEELKFVPGQIWVEILEPGQTLKWTPVQ